MGWDSATGPDGLWTCRTLPDAEALAVKEDLIIWPPVVIVHTSSAANYYLNERTASLESLQTSLRGLDFDKGMTKVCHGKAAIPNIMLVKFNGTESGLQEVERLHTIFSEKKHGRTELLQIDSGTYYSKEGAHEGLINKKVEGALFGYLGIAEDLDKLHYDTKAKCFVRSKKEIHTNIKFNAQISN
ncbi:hypothetical protein Ancab_011223 [Ancistrocladus abbreviatus]